MHKETYLNFCSLCLFLFRDNIYESYGFWMARCIIAEGGIECILFHAHHWELVVVMFILEECCLMMVINPITLFSSGWPAYFQR